MDETAILKDIIDINEKENKNLIEKLRIVGGIVSFILFILGFFACFNNIITGVFIMIFGIVFLCLMFTLAMILENQVMMNRLIRKKD